jgi:hypothetical protein
MFTLSLLIWAIVATTGWISWYLDSEELVKTKKLLEEARATTYSTPVKELAADFRNFVEGVDGKVSPEVEAILKKIEANEEVKALPEPIPRSRIVISGQVNTDTRPYIDDDTWELFWEDYRNEDFDEYSVKLVKTWGNRFRFSIAQQVEILNGLDFSDYRAMLRDYFATNQ